MSDDREVRIGSRRLIGFFSADTPDEVVAVIVNAARAGVDGRDTDEKANTGDAAGDDDER